MKKEAMIIRGVRFPKDLWEKVNKEAKLLRRATKRPFTASDVIRNAVWTDLQGK